MKRNRPPRGFPCILLAAGIFNRVVIFKGFLYITLEGGSLKQTINFRGDLPLLTLIRGELKSNSLLQGVPLSPSSRCFKPSLSFQEIFPFIPVIPLIVGILNQINVFQGVFPLSP